MVARRRFVALIGAAAAAVGFLVANVVTAPTASGADVDVGWCGIAPTTFPCIEAGTRDGVALPNGTWDISALSFTISGDPGRYLIFVATNGGPGNSELGEGDLSVEWSVTFNLGSDFVPRVASGHARDVDVDRSRAGGDYKITITGKPVIVTQGCDQSIWPWNCPRKATDERVGYFDAQITDYAVWDNVVEREAMYGMNYFTNIDATSQPPEIRDDPSTGVSQLLIRMANSHFRTDGMTLVVGRSELRIPNQFLRIAYGVPNPASMTGSGLVGTVSGGDPGVGTVDIWQEPGNDAMRVLLTDVNFSTRVLRIHRGVITPTRPTNVHTKRTGDHRGRVAFTASTPRGANVTGYRARCSAVTGSDTAYATAARSPVVVTGLRHARAYTCQVRALSKAGPGRWSSAVRMPRYPS